MLPRLARLCLLFALLALGLARPGPTPAWAGDWDDVEDRLIQEGYDEAEVRALFARPEARFDPGPLENKLRALFKLNFAPPQEEPPAPGSVYPGYLDPGPLAEAKRFLAEHLGLLESVEEKYGVPREIATAILEVETRCGRFLGERGVLVSLASLASGVDPDKLQPLIKELKPTPEQLDWLRAKALEKADWAFGELKALLEYARLNGLDPLAIRGSIYGAFGLCQFMPSNALLLGADGDGDGRVDLFNVPDAVHSLANYLLAFGWRPGLDRAGRRQVLWEYNHSDIYVNTVLALADRLGRKSP